MASWNIRGLNKPLKQNEVYDLIKEENINLCAVLESKVAVKNLRNICRKVFGSWTWCSNGGICKHGNRIILGWNPNVIDVMVLFQSTQGMHCQVFVQSSNKSFYCSIIYAANEVITTRELWKELEIHKRFVASNPWIALGDFNAALNIEDLACGVSGMPQGMVEFKNCTHNIEMVDLNSTWLKYTWNKKPQGGLGVLKKLDRVLVNTSFITQYPTTLAIFKPYMLSDHSAAVVRCQVVKNDPKPFKFSNFVSYKPDFEGTMKSKWMLDMNGHSMFKIVQKLKSLKKPLRKLSWEKGDIHKRVDICWLDLDESQGAVDKNTHDKDLREALKLRISLYNEACIEEERLFKKRAKMKWLKEGDGNKKYFHQTIKGRLNRSIIGRVKKLNGQVVEGDDIAVAFVEHYQEFLGKSENRAHIKHLDTLFVNKISVSKRMGPMVLRLDSSNRRGIF